MGFSIQLAPEDVSEGIVTNLNAVVDPAQGTFVFRGVPPGRYRLLANVGFPEPGGGVKQLSAELPVDVGGSDVDGLDLALDSGGALDIAFHGLTENHLDPAAVSASLRRADGSRAIRGWSRNTDGSFRFEGLPAGGYWLTTRTEAEACVESVKLGDREVRGAPLTIAAGASLRVDATVSRNCGSIRSRAVRDGEPVPGAKMVLLLSGTAQDPGDLIEDFANDEGELSFSGLTPGHYLPWAWAVEGKGVITGPGSLAAVERQATAVEVKEGEPLHVDVPLLKEEDKPQ